MKRFALVLLFAAVGCGSADELDESTLPLCDSADAGAALVQTAEVKLNLQRPDARAAAPKLERSAELRPALRDPLSRCVRR